MLILRRIRNQRIVIDNRVTIRVVKVRRETVRLVITPPGGDTVFLRKEGRTVIDEGQITITIVKFVLGSVEIGIDAPGMKIRRGELPRED